MMMKHSLAPRRCFCNEFAQERKQRGKVRVMGTVVDILDRATTTTKPDETSDTTYSSSRVVNTSATSQHYLEEESEGENAYSHTLVLDDGTGETVAIPAQSHMVQAVKLGDAVDCVIVVTSSGAPQHTKRNQQLPADMMMIESLMVMPEADQALTLRSLEIMHQRQGLGHTWGLPDDENQSPLTNEHIAEIIQAEAETGVSLDDLHEMFALEKEELQVMVQELQMQGLVYQSKNGNYLPL